MLKNIKNFKFKYFYLKFFKTYSTSEYNLKFFTKNDLHLIIYFFRTLDIFDYERIYDWYTILSINKFDSFPHLAMYSKNNDLIGLINCEERSEYKNHIEIELYINPKYQNKKYGTKLVNIFIKYCSAHKYFKNYRLFAGIDVDNISMRKILQSNNFISINEDNTQYIK